MSLRKKYSKPPVEPDYSVLRTYDPSVMGFPNMSFNQSMPSTSSFKGDYFTGGELKDDGHLREGKGGIASRSVAPAASSGARKPASSDAPSIASYSARDTSLYTPSKEETFVDDDGAIYAIQWRKVSDSPLHYTPFIFDGRQLWDVVRAQGAWRKLFMLPYSQKAAYMSNGEPQLVQLVSCTYNPVMD